MRKIESVLERIESQINKINKQRVLNVRELWKNIAPAELNLMEEAVEVFLENFGNRYIQNDFAVIQDDFSPQQRTNTILKNFVQLNTILIMYLHREELEMIEKVCKHNSLAIALKWAEESFYISQDKEV